MLHTDKQGRCDMESVPLDRDDPGLMTTGKQTDQCLFKIDQQVLM